MILDHEHKHNRFLSDQIDKLATRDQTKTSIRLQKAYARIWQPKRNGDDMFEEIRKELTEVICAALKQSDIEVDDYLWGLSYDNGDGAGFHHHHGSLYSAIYYLKADEGCGSLLFKNPFVEIEPEDNMLVIFDADLNHAVSPNVVKDAKRICIAMNIKPRLT